MSDRPPAWSRTFHLPDEAATARLGEALAAHLRLGDVVLLSGGLGAGKTSVARAVIRARAGLAALEVPSPTFTLVQTYETDGLTISHYDLYRIADPSELREIGFEDVAEVGAVLVEWPERAPALMPDGALTIRLAIDGSGRTAALGGDARWAERLGNLPQDL